MEYETAPALRDNSTETKASPAHLMGVKKTEKQTHRLHHPRSIAFITHDQADSMWLP